MTTAAYDILADLLSSRCLLFVIDLDAPEADRAPVTRERCRGFFNNSNWSEKKEKGEVLRP